MLRDAHRRHSVLLRARRPRPLDRAPHQAASDAPRASSAGRRAARVPWPRGRRASTRRPPSSTASSGCLAEASQRAAAAAAGAGFFALLFGGAWNDALVAASVGALISRFPLAMGGRRMPDFFTNLVAGAAATLLCLAAGRAGLASNEDATAIGVLMLLVPGVAVTNAIRDTIAGDLVAGVARGADALMSAAAISAGAGVAYQLWRLAGQAASLMRLLEPLWAGLATAGFAAMFNLRGRDLPLAAAGGALGWAVAAPVQGATGSQAIGLLRGLDRDRRLVPSSSRLSGSARPRSTSPAASSPSCPEAACTTRCSRTYEATAGTGSPPASATLLAAGAIAAGLAVSGAVFRMRRTGQEDAAVLTRRRGSRSLPPGRR